MPSQVRQRMIVGAAELLSQHGLQATSFAEVTQATQTPRGSIYHHFPGGKNELVLAAVDLNAEKWSASVGDATRAGTVEFVADLLRMLHGYLGEHEFNAGSVVGAVVIGAENAEQLEHCKAAFEVFIRGVAEGLVETGVERSAAEQYAASFVASIAGATLLARATRRFDEFDALAAMLTAQAGQLPQA